MSRDTYPITESKNIKKRKNSTTVVYVNLRGIVELLESLNIAGVLLSWCFPKNKVPFLLRRILKRCIGLTQRLGKS